MAITYEDLKVYWLPAVAAKAAPTVAEIAAGTDLSALVPVDGVSQGGSRNTADQAYLGDAYVASQVGTWQDTLEITFRRIPTTAWDLFAGNYGTAGFIMLAPEGAVIATSKVEVLPVEVHEPIEQASAENEHVKFTVTFAVTEAPARQAVVAA